MKQLKKIRKSTIGLVQTGVALGVGTSIVAGVGGNTSALGTVGGLMSPITTGVMGYHTLGLVKDLYGKKKKRR